MLYEAYASLVKEFPDNCDQLFGQSVSQDRSLWLSIDGDAYPSLLFAARRDDARNDIDLRSLSVQFSRNCSLEIAGGEVASGVFTVVRLNENDPDLVRMLLRVLEEAFQDKERAYNNNEIASRIQEIANLFRAIGNSTSDIIGLWGELHVLSCAKQVEVAARAWCQTEKAKYDFVTSEFAVEVKTTLRSKRKHRFSLDQLRPTGGFTAFIASVSLVEVNSGRSTAELMDDIYEKLPDGELRGEFFTLCMIKGGEDIFRSTIKLDCLPDQSSLLCFRANDVPVPDVADGSPIDNVRFDVDFSGLTPVSQRVVETILSFGSD